MASDLQFPKTRHLTLSGTEHPHPPDADARARADASEALIVAFGGAATALPAADPADTKKTATRLPRLIAVDVAAAEGAHETCQSRGGKNAEVGGVGIRCVSSTQGRAKAGERASAASLQGEAVLVVGLDRWYRQGADDAGFCRSCELATVEALRESYGEQVQPWDPLAALRVPGGRERPFAGLRELLRLTEAVDFCKRCVLRARDEARKSGPNTPERELLLFGQVGPLTGFALALCRHLDGLVFELPSVDPAQCILPLIAARAALGQRPAIATPPATATAQETSLLAALAAACGADLLLAPGASAEAHAALANQRRFSALVRERYRASEPLLDAEVLVSPLVDHWTQGAHLRAATLCAAALSRSHLLVGARLAVEGPASGRAQLLVLAGCEALSATEAKAARRHVETGGDLLLVGRAAVIDDEGRPGDPVFLEVKPGMNRLGEGRLYFVEAPQAQAAPQAQSAQLVQPLEQAVLRGARELFGRGRAQLTLSGRGQIFARAYLDPERKLDVHLVNLDLTAGQLVPSQGALLHIAGQAAGAGRTGYWFAPERDGGRDGERISLNPSGFSVSTVLPSFAVAALLAVPR